MLSAPIVLQCLILIVVVVIQIKVLYTVPKHKMLYFKFKYGITNKELLEKGWVVKDSVSTVEIQYLILKGVLVSFDSLNIEFFNEDNFYTFKDNPFNVRIVSNVSGDVTIFQLISDVFKGV